MNCGAPDRRAGQAGLLVELQAKLAEERHSLENPRLFVCVRQTIEKRIRLLGFEIETLTRGGSEPERSAGL
jgi:hypothetical protein